MKVLLYNRPSIICLDNQLIKCLPGKIEKRQPTDNTSLASHDVFQ